MSEYIVSGAEPNNTVLKGITPNGYKSERWLPVRERIVRCRDCKHADWYGAAGVGMFRCAAHGWSGDNSDGFCAWGERKEGV